MTAAREVERWLVAFGVRVAATMKAEDATLRARDYAKGMLDLPAEVFCDASREAASRQFEYFPSYAVLRKFLEGWWEENRPKPLMLAGSDDSGLEREDRLMLDVWQRRRAAGFPPELALDKLSEAPPVDQHTFRRRLMASLDLMRNNGRMARMFRYILRTDVEAAAIAVQRRWREAEIAEDQDTRLAADWGSITEPEVLSKLDAIRSLSLAPSPLALGLANANLSLLRAAIGKYSPHHLPLLPEKIVLAPQRQQPNEAKSAADEAREASAKLAAQFYAKHGRKPGELTPEQLATTRRTAGIHHPSPPDVGGGR